MLKFGMKYLGAILALFVGCLIHLENISFGAGECLSARDEVFLTKLGEQYPRIERAGGGIILSMNGYKFPVNRVQLALESDYFSALFSTGIECRVTAPNSSSEQTVSLKPLEIGEMCEVPFSPLPFSTQLCTPQDLFAKILRIVFEKRFDPFTAEQDPDGELTKEISRKLAFFQLSHYLDVLTAPLKVQDQVSLELMMDLRAGHALGEDPEKPLGQDSEAKLMAYARANGNCRQSDRALLLSCLSSQYLAENIPGLRGLPGFRPQTQVQGQIQCPTGYILVPGNPDYGNQDFCVMKYEASNDGHGHAVSVIGARPWVSINREAAANACRMNNTPENQRLGTFDLISNAQWMTIARNIESNPANWNQGIGPVGTGTLSRGNSNHTEALAAAGDENPYSGLPAPQQGDWTHKRTLILSNGEVIWDLAGNVWEWVLDDLITGRHEWQEFNSTHFAAGTANRNLYAPLGNYNSSQNVGRAFLWNGGAALRGGFWHADADAGVFAVYLYYSASDTNAGLGFRCAFVPAQ